ncbi:hypothetical protein, partial [Streptomyces mirabilis]
MTVAPSPASPPTTALAGSNFSPAALFHSAKLSAFHAGRTTSGGVTQLAHSPRTSSTRLSRSAPTPPRTQHTTRHTRQRTEHGVPPVPRLPRPRRQLA